MINMRTCMKYKHFINTNKITESYVKYLSSSSFNPPPLNKYNGTAVYDNIDISDTTDNIGVDRNTDAESVSVVTGASRGIGLQIVKSQLQHTKGKVIACVRDPEKSHHLMEFLKHDKDAERVHIEQLDITDDAQISDFAEKVKNEFNRVDTLFNVAGILGDSINTPGPEKALRQIDGDWLRKNLNVNLVAPIIMSKSLAPLMKTKAGRKSTRPPSIIINFSARVGSIADNIGGISWHSYRCSKAGLNMATRSLSHELRRQGTWTFAYYPGFTDTDLSKPFQKGVKKDIIFPVDFTVDRLLLLVRNMEERHSGGFYDWAGQALPF